MEANYKGSSRVPTYFTIDTQTLYAQQQYFLIISGVKKVFKGYTDFLVYGHGYNKVGDIAPIVGSGYIDNKGIHISFTSPLIQYSTGNWSPNTPSLFGLYTTYIINTVMDFDLNFKNGRWHQFNSVTNSNLVTDHWNNYDNDYIVGKIFTCSP